jgi:hypothetical protein
MQYCCWALKNLALNETNKKRIAASRAPQLIVEVPVMLTVVNFTVKLTVVNLADG